MFRPATDNKKIIEDIQTAFYNPILEYILFDASVTQENLRDKFRSALEKVVSDILEQSSRMPDAIRLPNGITLTIENCPATYQVLFKHLILFKQTNNKSSLEQAMACLFQHPNFQAMYPKLGIFIGEAKGWKAVQKHAHSYDVSGITIPLIRETFYNEMVSQIIFGIENNYISRDDIESQEPFIYLALSALTILEAIKQSKDCNGIRLLNDKLLNKSNCPTDEGFDQLFMPLLDNLNKIANIIDRQLAFLRYLCLNTDKPIPADLLSLQTKDITDCAVIVNRVATMISQRPYFHNMITQVMNTYLESCQPVSRFKL